MLHGIMCPHLFANRSSFLSDHNSACTVQLAPGADRVLDVVVSGQMVSPTQYHLQLLAERLMLVADFGELVCLDRLNFAPFDYQIKAAMAVLRRFRGRGLLCDEVGLGKTIEAGLVLNEYLQRQMVNRVLILTPPSLVEQWHEELSAKFDRLDFVTSSQPDFRALGSQAWAEFPRVIASLAVARLAQHRHQIAAIPYDLVVVDEAHHLKNRTSVSWKFINTLQRKYILLLTATPVQNNLDELYNLITLLKPGQLRTPRQFREQFMVQGDPRLPKNRGRLRELLADTMVRHSRSQVNVALPARHAHTIRLRLSPEERSLYDAVTGFVREEFQLRQADADLPDAEAPPERLSQSHRFTLQTLQREIGSSPQAVEPTLRRMAGRSSRPAQRDRLLALAERATGVTSWAKAEALDKLLEALLRPGAGQTERIIIFTHFQRTLETLIRRLQGRGVPTEVYHGGLSSQAKDEVIHRFEATGGVLLSTEAAGEGRNLQFCHIMINFDLPWNPMRIEQRVGRIHRIGQTQPVDIYNLSAENTVEDYILDILDRKLNMFELVIGEMDMILGHLSDERDFEELVADIWLQATTPDEAARGFEQLGDAMLQARAAYRQAQEYDEILFGEDFTAE
jgi:SNF2 family DNA or RNA helicase